MLTSSGWNALRLDAKASHTINISIITATMEIKDPTEEIVFHSV